MPASPKARYLTLDALRGVAAIVVCLLHTTDFWGGVDLPSGHLAVDLFFVLSGFIVAEVYGPRLQQGLGAAAFLKLRLIRFYPIFFVGLLLGASRDLLSYRFGLNETGYTPFAFLGSLTLNLAFLPSPFLGPKHFFPMLGVAWTLFYELLINGVAAAFWRQWSKGLLWALLALSGLAVLLQSKAVPGLEGGSGWRFEDWSLALTRVSYSFFAGLLLQKLDRSRWPRLPYIVPLALGAGLLLVDPGQWLGAYAALAVLVGFPAVVAMGMVAVEPKGSAAKLATFLGVISYPLYAIHMPLGALVQGVMKRAWVPVNDLAPWSGLVLLAGMLSFCWWLDRVWDRPIRRWLGR